jgi:superfamily II DNA or RNA helicase
LGSLLAFLQLRREGRLGGFVVFCHRSSIARQWQAAAQQLGLDLREWEPCPDAAPAVGLLLSYQSAARHRRHLEQVLAGRLEGGPWLAIADEVHHLGIDPEEPEATAWGHAFTTLTAQARLRLGLSGTPFRADNLAFCAARRLRVLEQGVPCERIVPDLCVEPRRLIGAGDVRPLEFRFQDGTVEHDHRHARSGRPGASETSPLSAEQRESWRARNLRRAIRLGDGGGIALRLLLQARQRLERVRLEHPEAGGLVIARDIAHARAIRDLLEEQGDRTHLVHSQDPAAAAHLGSFRGGAGDWLVSIDMCAEGFDAPRIRVVAYLTTVVTRSRFLQAITRAVRMDGERGGEGADSTPSFLRVRAGRSTADALRAKLVAERAVLAAPPNGAPASSRRRIDGCAGSAGAPGGRGRHGGGADPAAGPPAAVLPGPRRQSATRSLNRSIGSQERTIQAEPWPKSATGDGKLKRIDPGLAWDVRRCVNQYRPMGHQPAAYGPSGGRHVDEQPQSTTWQRQHPRRP